MNVLINCSFCLLVTLQLSAYGADLSSEACRELGFSSNLLCSSCDLLGEFSLNKLQPDCGQCCQQEAQMEARKVKGTTELQGVGKQKVIACLERFANTFLIGDSYETYDPVKSDRIYHDAPICKIGSFP
uniref:Selenoprotein F n=1 Tax=Sander lucioperca TaxID=283035 RepID=A0A8C9ZQ31_SANLU